MKDITQIKYDPVENCDRCKTLLQDLKQKREAITNYYPFQAGRADIINYILKEYFNE